MKSRYRYKRNKNEEGYFILEDGHTMFPEDVIKLLKRLEFLEEKYRVPSCDYENNCSNLKHNACSTCKRKFKFCTSDWFKPLT